jgi:hypothetical protein
MGNPLPRTGTGETHRARLLAPSMSTRAWAALCDQERSAIEELLFSGAPICLPDRCWAERAEGFKVSTAGDSGELDRRGF